MKSNYYCPKCKSFSYIRVHRRFFHKYILGVQQRYQCRDCKTVFTNKDIAKNTLLDFNDTQHGVSVK
jgi:transposase-like protein